jgi:hypothetical protein
MFNLANCRLHCSCSRGRSSSGLGRRRKSVATTGRDGSVHLATRHAGNIRRRVNLILQTKTFANRRFPYEYSTASRPEDEVLGVFDGTESRHRGSHKGSGDYMASRIAISGEAARQVILRGANQLAVAVKVTLRQRGGTWLPKGSSARRTSLAV